MKLKNIFIDFVGREYPTSLSQEEQIELGTPQEKIAASQGTQVRSRDMSRIERYTLKNKQMMLEDELEYVASQHGLDVRVWLPGIQPGTVGYSGEYQKNRANVFISKDDEGKLYINDQFCFG